MEKGGGDRSTLPNRGRQYGHLLVRAFVYLVVAKLDEARDALAEL